MFTRRLLTTFAALAALILPLLATTQPQTASPPRCNRRDTRTGALLLPTLSFGSGDATFSCTTTAHSAFVDLAGAIATEDARGDTYTLADGEVLVFSRADLPRICDDVLRFIPAATATLDGAAIPATAVVTRNFIVRVNPGADNSPGASPFFQDSIDLGHRGRLAACFSGYKALVPLHPGHHVIAVDLSAIVGIPTELTYDVTVARHS